MKKQYLIPATQEHEMTFGQMMVGSNNIGKGGDVTGSSENPIYIN